MGGVYHLYGILKSTDFDSLMSDAQLEESKQGKSKKSSLLKTTVVPSSIKRLKQNVNEGQEKSQFRNDKARCMGFLLSIVKIFLQAALITVDQDKLLGLIM
jgi:hypothetical protein